MAAAYWKKQTKSGKTARLTPESILLLVREVFGGQIGLDPCGHKDSLVDAKRTYLLPKDNGLTLPWRGFGGVYANIPWGRGSTRLWTEKIQKEFNTPAPRVLSEILQDECILLCPARMGSVWLQETVLPFAQASLAWKGRLTFGGKGLKGEPAMFDSLFAYYGPNRHRFLEVFGPFGWAITGR